ncbi:MAG: hypothetical protein ACI9HU_000236 [Colwellia sp.]|jgi:hypothetical protein
MSIKIDKKYVSHSLLNFYRVGDNVSVNIAGATVTAIDGDEYTLDMPNAEREVFIDKCSVRCAGVAISSEDYGRLYDIGARFK